MRGFRELILFAVAGTAGFLADAGVLYLVKASLGLFLGRLLSFLCAVLTTWLINRALAFRSYRSGLGPHREFFIYLMLMVAGGSVNYLLYSLLVLGLPAVEDNPIIGVAAGSIAGMLVNFSLARSVLFKRVK